jgi:hypothetical protein
MKSSEDLKPLNSVINQITEILGLLSFPQFYCVIVDASVHMFSNKPRFYEIRGSHGEDIGVVLLDTI